MCCIAVMSRDDGIDLGELDAGRPGDGRESAFRLLLSHVRGECPHSFIGKVNKGEALGQPHPSQKSGRLTVPQVGQRKRAAMVLMGKSQMQLIQPPIKVWGARHLALLS
jgi:hypothetical protein